MYQDLEMRVAMSEIPYGVSIFPIPSYGSHIISNYSHDIHSDISDVLPSQFFEQIALEKDLSCNCYDVHSMVSYAVSYVIMVAICR
jgi:hypothetical protein